MLFREARKKAIRLAYSIDYKEYALKGLLGIGIFQKQVD
jgi:hypothetical protein